MPSHGSYMKHGKARAEAGVKMWSQANESKEHLESPDVGKTKTRASLELLEEASWQKACFPTLLCLVYLRI